MGKHIFCLCGLGILLLLITGVCNALAAEFHVTDAAGIHTAVGIAAGNDEEDTIFLAAGTYQGGFTLGSNDSKPINLRGEPGTSAQDVILDGQGTQTVLSAGGPVEEGGTTIEGLTIQNGGHSGLSIFCEYGDCRVTVGNVIIQNNSTTYYGGGVYINVEEEGTLNIEIHDSVIRNNQAPGNSAGKAGRGGGIYGASRYGNASVDLLIVNTLIYKNQVNWDGGGLHVTASEVGENNFIHATVVNSTITDNLSNMHGNTFGMGGGISVTGWGGDEGIGIAYVDLYNTIVYGNTALDKDEECYNLYVDVSHEGIAEVNAYSSDIGDVCGNEALYHPINVINADPLFVDPGNGDYHLWSESPCIDAGSNSAPGLPAFDFEGEGRVLDGDEDGTGTVDMGADEYVPAIYNLVTLLSPNGTEAIPSGSTRTIRWGAPSEITKFKLMYSRDNGKSWRQIHEEVFVEGTSYDWQVPTPMKNEKNCLIRVCGFDESNERVGCDRSENPLTVEVVRLISPNGGESWDSGNDQTIRWTTHETKPPVAKVNLYFSKNGGKSWKLIGSETGDPENHAWTLPILEKTKDRCKVKVQLRDADRRIVGEDVSDGVFTVNATE